MNKTLPLLIALVALSSCASRYTLISPRNVHYQTNTSHAEVDFSYKYDVLNERGNRKYAKRESIKGTKVVAVKITNNTNAPFVFGQDRKIHANGNAINVLEPSLIHQNLKQGVPIYLLYLLLTPMQVYNGNESTPVGLVLGPGITAGNMLTAGNANKNFKAELEDHFLNGKTIHAGETVYGIIGIYDAGYSPLTLE